MIMRIPQNRFQCDKLQCFNCGIANYRSYENSICFHSGKLNEHYKELDAEIMAEIEYEQEQAEAQAMYEAEMQAQAEAEAQYEAEQCYYEGY
jgi:hypothetical protein